MSSVGTLLRNARITQGVTLEEISARTRIVLKNLHAIESDDLGQFSSPFLYRSFVRQFADEVKVDYDSIAAAVLEASGVMPQPRLPGESDSPIVRVPLLQPRVRSDYHWIYSAAILILVIAACSGGYTVWRHLSTLKTSAGVPAPPAGTFSPDVNRPKDLISGNRPAPVTRVPQPAVSPAPEPPAAAEADSGIHIQLSAIETTWLSIIADGKETYRGLLKASQTKILDGRQTARIKTGNAGGVTIVFNGKELGPIGRRGETRTVLFTTRGYEVVRSAGLALVPVDFEPLSPLISKRPIRIDE